MIPCHQDIVAKCYIGIETRLACDQSTNRNAESLNTTVLTQVQSTLRVMLRYRFMRERTGNMSTTRTMTDT